MSLERVSDHFYFSVESTGALTSRELVAEAFKILAEKARNILEQFGGAGGLHTLSHSYAKAHLNSVMRENLEEE